MSGRTLVLESGGREYGIERLPDGAVRVDGQEFTVRATADGTVEIRGERTARAWRLVSGDRHWVFFEGRVYEFTERAAHGPRRRAPTHHGTLSAPMPATVRQIAVRQGDRVSRGDTLLVLEAMKMELPVRAPAAGVIEAVNCREGELVQPGAALIEMEEHD